MRLSTIRVTSQEEALEIIAEESDNAHVTLCTRRESNGLLYEPDPNDLHVWELETTTKQSRWTTLFLTRELAIRYAVEFYGLYVIKAEDDKHADTFKKLLDAEAYEAILREAENHYGMSVRVQTVPVRTSSAPQMASFVLGGDNVQA